VLKRIVLGLVFILLVVPSMAPAEESKTDESVPVAVPEPTAKAMRYYRSGVWIWVAGELIALAVPGAILLTGTSVKLRDAAFRVGRYWPIAAGLFLAAYFLLTGLIEWPWDYYAGFVRAHEYGLSNQTIGRWMRNRLVAMGVNLGLALVLAWIPFGLLRLSPKRWWLWLGMVFVPFLFVVVLIKPIWFDPLFNEFGPMRDKALEARVLDLADRAGIEGSTVYQVDKSRDTKTVNAYVTGFLGTKRIVLWDTILEKLEPDELLFVMGHEMGHYVLGHVVRGILVSSALTLFGMFLVALWGNRIVRRYSSRLGFDRLSDFAALPLLLVLGGVVSLLLTPVGFAYSRHIEHEADRFALELTHMNRSGALAFVALQKENLSNPRPGLLSTIWRSTHPNLGQRIDFCNAYHPWREGKPSRYTGHFRESRRTTAAGPSRATP
jgi:Zn-dependent protease with chaperone function